MSKKFDVVYGNPNNIPPVCCSIFGGIFAWSDLGKMPLEEMTLTFNPTLGRFGQLFGLQMRIVTAGNGLVCQTMRQN